MAKITKEEAIEIAHKMMGTISPYRLLEAHFFESNLERKYPHWFIVCQELNENGNPKVQDPGTIQIIVDAETGEARYNPQL